MTTDDGHVVVCPKCGYGFGADDPRSSYTCPNRECGYSWQAVSLTEVDAYSADGRPLLHELHVVSGFAPARFELPEGETVIGRSPDCAVRLGNLQVSRRHAAVQRRGQQCVLADLDSSGGTRLNGSRLTEPAELFVGDRIMIGGIVLEYRVRVEKRDRQEQGAERERLVAVGQRIGMLVHGTRSDRIDVDPGSRITLGRDQTCDVCLPFPMVSRKHARIVRENDETSVIDLKSGNGTFVNGDRIIRQALDKDDRLQVGPFLFVFDGRSLRRETALRDVQVDAHGLEVTVHSGGAKQKILDRVGLSIAAGELVGIIGPSGSGKTTLLKALCGLRPADRGYVLVNGESLYDSYDLYRTTLGYVPQDDIVHPELNVLDTLGYAAMLRLPPDTAGPEREQIVRETAEVLGLAESLGTRVGRLSGGQRKRVSIGVELLARPRLLFLDEPTSGLDPATERTLMRLFRRLADRGHTVVCSTHIMENVDLLDKVAVLVGGKLAFFGSPDDARNYFGVDKITMLYEVLAEKEAESWRREFISGARRRDGTGETPAFREPPRPVGGQSGQFLTLLRRYFAILASDPKNIALLALQPVLITFLICVTSSELPMIFFLAVLSVLWFGSSNAAKEIVKETAVYTRERMVNLSVSAYVGSKITVLAGIAAVQCAIVGGIIAMFQGGVHHMPSLVLVLLLAAVAGTALGLLISAMSSNVTKAITAVPLVLIPQIILAGVIVPLGDMNRPVSAASYLTISRWANQACEVLIVQDREVDRELLSEYPRVLQNLYPGYSLLDGEDTQKFLADYGGEEVEKLGMLLGNLAAVIAIAGLCLISTVIALWERERRVL